MVNEGDEKQVRYNVAITQPHAISVLPQLQTGSELPSLHFQELLSECIDSAAAIMLSDKQQKQLMKLAIKGKMIHYGHTQLYQYNEEKLSRKHPMNMLFQNSQLGRICFHSSKCVPSFTIRARLEPVRNRCHRTVYSTVLST